MKIGFTGTREGMTEAQRISVLELIKTLNPREAHHGDCVGADEEFAGLCDELSKARVEAIWLVSHPPSNEKLRAFTRADEIRKPKDYLLRDFDIVEETVALIGAPKQEVRPTTVRGSGTWQTIAYAMVSHRPVHVVWPNGRVETF